MQQDKYKLFYGDCFDFLPSIEDESIDAIITDLPYGTTSCSWDEIIPITPMWKQVKRIAKEKCNFITTSAQPFTSILVCSNLEWFKYETIWHKITKLGGSFDAKNRPMIAHENILIFSNADIPTNSKNKMVYNEQGTRKINSRVKNDLAFRANRGGNRPGLQKSYIQTETNHPTTVTTFIHDTSGNHETQKPLSLYEYLVLTYTNKNDTVLDFCMGSGTTGEACMKLDRKFIGIEKDKKYFDIAEKRIREASQQMNMFTDT